MAPVLALDGLKGSSLSFHQETVRRRDNVLGKLEVSLLHPRLFLGLPD